MKVFIWICNISVFMIPNNEIHNKWFAHSDLITNYAIGVCSSISSSIISIIMLPICAVVETYVFMFNSIPEIIPYFRIKVSESLFSRVLNYLLLSYRRDSNLYLIVFSCLCFWCYLLYFFALVTLLCFSPCMLIVLPFLLLVFVVVLLNEILLVAKENMTFLYYQIIISSFFLTKEERDIWDIQGPKILKEFNENENITIYELSALARIQWYYDNFIPEKSLRLIF